MDFCDYNYSFEGCLKGKITVTFEKMPIFLMFFDRKFAFTDKALTFVPLIM